MKNKFLRIFSVVLVLIVGGCDSYLDINTNPNAPTATNPDYVVSGALVTTAAIKASAGVQRPISQWTGYFSASGSYSQSGDYVRTYSVPANNFINENQWAGWYSNIANYNWIEENTKNVVNYDYYVAVSKIMKAYIFQNLVDCYGNVPYSDALKGFGQLSPKYDDAQTIYDALSTELHDAVNIIKNAPVSARPLVATVDLVFQGNMTHWAELANTLRLRLMIHQSKLSRDSYITGEITDILANGYGFLSADANIQPGYTKAEGQQNPFWENNGWTVGNAYAGRDYLRVSNFSLNLLQGKGDPRIDYLFRLPSTDPGTSAPAKAVAWSDASYPIGAVVKYTDDVYYSAIKPIVAGTGKLPGGPEWATYKGTDFGALPTTDISSAYTSGFGTGIMGSPNQAYPLFGLAQAYFLQAQAALLGWIPGGAGAALASYKSGIKASCDYLGVPASLTATYIAATPTNDFTANNLNAVLIQKWIANYAIDPIEAWTDIRREGIPAVPKSLDPGVIDIPSGVTVNVPIRILYPQTEYNVNTSNVQAQGAVSTFSPKIFWNQ